MRRPDHVRSAGTTRRWRSVPQGGARAGLTLIELMAAMMVLLVGVWAVAALFPKLSRDVVQREREMTTVREVAELSASYRADPELAEISTSPAPASGAASESNTETADPNARPVDPDSTNLALNPPNGRDDWVWVWGETFVVPQPSVPGGACTYLPRGGLLDQFGHWYDGSDGNPAERDYSNRASRHVSGLQVFQLTELKRATRATDLPANSFFLTNDGYLLTNTTAPKLLVDYTWYDAGDNLLKRTAREWVVPLQSNLVAAGTNVVPGDETVYAVSELGVGLVPPASPPPAQCGVPTPYRHALLFNPGYAGRKLTINYRILREGGRRQPLMYEDVTIPQRQWDPNQVAYVMPPIKLAYAGLDDERPAIAVWLSGTEVLNTHVLAVAASDGTALPWEAVLVNGAVDPARSCVDTDPPDTRFAFRYVDFANGVLEFNPYNAAVAAHVGDSVRIFYRTIDENSVQLQKAPARFSPVLSGTTPAVLAGSQYWRAIGQRYQTGRDPNRTEVVFLYDFSRHLEDQAVQVDYLVQPPGAASPVRVNDEVHVISDLDDPNLGLGFVLNQPYVVGVMDVRGVSMRVCGWWRTETGRVSMTDLSSMLFPGA